MASNVVALAAIFPRVRGVRPAGDLGVAGADGVESVGFDDFDSKSDHVSASQSRFRLRHMTDHGVRCQLLS